MAAPSSIFRRTGIAIVLCHTVIGFVHSAAHNELHIYMSSWQNVYIFLMILALPLVAAALLWRRSGKGFVVLLVSMFGSLLFGGHYHFVLPGPDHVGHLMPHAWTVPFQVSAVLLAITEAAGVFAGFMGLGSHRSN